MTRALSSLVSRADLDDSIVGAVAFLRANQLANGEFNTYVSVQNKPWELESSPFCTTFVVYALGFVETESARDMIAKSLDFFVAEMDARGVWRYWTKRLPKHLWLPPDLDDTSCISFLLIKYGVSFTSNRQLILANRNRRGLFYTWLVMRAEAFWHWKQWGAILQQLSSFPAHPYDTLWKTKSMATTDLDCTVNANVLLYLGQDAETQSTIDYLISILRERRESESDLWYQHPFCFYYFVSRAYVNGVKGLGAVKNEVMERIRGTVQGMDAPDHELAAALAISTALNFDADPTVMEKLLAYLVNTQSDNGAWPRIPMWGGYKKWALYGSEELTTALCLEALARYRTRVYG